MIALITGVLTLLAMVLEIIVQNRQTEREKRYDDIQKGRKDIANGDTVAVDNRIDRLLSVPSGTERGTVTGQQGSEDIERRISEL